MKFLSLLLSFFSLSSCYLNLKGSHYAQFHSEDFSYNLETDSEFFYVDLNISVYESRGEEAPIYDINTTEIISDSDSRNSPSNCEIEYIPNEDGEEDDQKSETKVCVMDIPEASFKLKPLALYLNIPEGMCSFVQWNLPWYINQEILLGPDVEQREVGTEDDKKTKFCEIGKSNCKDKEEELCTSEIGKGQDETVKCCYGGKKTGGKIWNPDPACFIGPALISEEISPESFYVTQTQDLTNAHGNIRVPVTLKALKDIDSTKASAIHHANYFSGLDQPLEEVKKLKVGEGKLNKGFYKQGAYKESPQPFFSFACLDSAQEVKHEILFMIREWNTLEDFMEFYYSGDEDAGEGPNVEGLEGEDCKHEERISLAGGSSTCNDFCDLDDYAELTKNDWCEKGYPKEELETSETQSSN